MVISDGFEEPPKLFGPIRALRARECAVQFVHMLHSHEVDLPFEGVCEFRSLEAPGRLVAEPHLIRSIYMERLDEHLTVLANEARRARIGYLRVHSDQPSEAALFELLRQGIP